MKKKILVVDDDEMIRTLYQEILTNEGYQVDIAADGISALDKIKANFYDLIVLDVVMPKLDGLQCLKEIKKTGVKCKILMTTNLSKSAVQEEIEKSGADDYIYKSNTIPDEFVAKIKNLIL